MAISLSFVFILSSSSNVWLVRFVMLVFCIVTVFSGGRIIVPMAVLSKPFVS